jgi:hypothetical protein
MGSEEDAVFLLGSTLLGNGVELLNTAYLPMLSLSVRVLWVFTLFL